MLASWSSIQYNLLEVKHIEKWKIFRKKTFFFFQQASDASKLLCDNNTLKSYHVNRSDFLKKTWLSGQNLQ